MCIDHGSIPRGSHLAHMKTSRLVRSWTPPDLPLLSCLQGELWRSRPGPTSLFGGRTLLLLAVPGLDTSGNHAAKPDPATSTTSSGFRVPYPLSMASELLFNDGPTRRYGVPYLKGGVFIPAFSQPMTRRFERPMAGARPVVDGTAQKTASKKLLITRNAPPPDVGPPLP